MTKLHEVKFPAECKTLPDGFWSAVDVWIKKPHVVNKRLCGATETPSEEVGTENLGVLLDPKSTDSHDVLSFLTRGEYPTALTHDQENTWTFSVRTFIPKVNCYGSTSHKEFVLKGESVMPGDVLVDIRLLSSSGNHSCSFVLFLFF